jgi:mannitol/fructose-specific phosphotransferase system IIA component (Ntr-type)
VEWNSIDGSKVKIAIALSVPLDANGDQHITILSSIARKLVNKSFRTALTEATTPSALYELINKVEIK